MARWLLKFLNGCISFALSLALLTAGVYSVYCLWDNSQIYSAAENVQAELLHLKPQVSGDEEADAGPTFDELLLINPDVCAWVAMDNTKIDHPVLQGATNLDYINTDVYGNFALAGSIFLDSRNDKTFSEPYAVLYGHHMEHSGMFGDLDLYKEETFFNENQTGILILPDRTYTLQTFACMLVSASEDRIFTPSKWKRGINGLLNYAQEQALFADTETIDALRTAIEAGEEPQVLAQIYHGHTSFTPVGVS